MWKRLALSSFLLFSAAFFFAEELPTNASRLKVSFAEAKGHIDYFNSDQVPDGFAQKASNVNFTRGKRSLTPRKGWGFFANHQLTVAPPYFPKSIHVYVSTSNTKYLVTRVQETWEAFSVANATSTNINIGNAGGFAFDTDAFQWDEFIYLVSQTTAMYRLQETTPNQALQITNVSTGPQGQISSVHLNRALISGDTGQMLTVYFSAADNPESWPSLNYLTITGVRDGDKITGLGQTLLGSLPIYTNNTTRIIQGTVFPSAETAGNTTVRVVSDSIGCINHKTIKNLNNKQYFLSGGPNGTIPGIYVFNGISVKEVTKGQRNLFKGIAEVQVSTLNRSNGFVFENKYCVSFATVHPSIGSDKVTVCVDEENNVYEWPHGIVRSNPASYFSIDGIVSLDGKYYMTGGNSDNTVWMRRNWVYGEMDEDNATTKSLSGNTMGAEIQWSYKTKDYDMGDNARYKLPDRAYISSDYWPTSFTVTANYDFGRSSTSWVINSTTNYTATSTTTRIDGSRETVMFSSPSVIVNKLKFPRDIRFNYVNFEISGSTYASIRYLDFYAKPEILR